MNSPPHVIRQTARAALSPRGLNELNLQPNILWPDTRSSRKVLKPKPKKKKEGGRRQRTRRRRRSRKRRGRGISQSKPQEEKEDARAAAHLRRLDEIQEELDFKIACMKRFMNSAPTNDIDKVQRLQERNFVKAAYAAMIKWCKENPTNTMNIGGRRRKNRRKKRTSRRRRRRKNRRKKRTRRRKGGQPKQNQKRTRLAATDEQWAKKVGASGPPIAVGPNITANHPAVRSSPGAYLARLQLATQDSQQLAKNEKYMNELLEFSNDEQDGGRRSKNRLKKRTRKRKKSGSGPGQSKSIKEGYFDDTPSGRALRVHANDVSSEDSFPTARDGGVESSDDDEYVNFEQYVLEQEQHEARRAGPVVSVPDENDTTGPDENDIFLTCEEGEGRGHDQPLTFRAKIDDMLTWKCPMCPRICLKQGIDHRSRRDRLRRGRAAADAAPIRREPTPSPSAARKGKRALMSEISMDEEHKAAHPSKPSNMQKAMSHLQPLGEYFGLRRTKNRQDPSYQEELEELKNKKKKTPKERARIKQIMKMRAASARGDFRGWTCSVCQYQNKPGERNCEMCHTPAPSAPAPPVRAERGFTGSRRKGRAATVAAARRNNERRRLAARARRIQRRWRERKESEALGDEGGGKLWSESPASRRASAEKLTAPLTADQHETLYNPFVDGSPKTRKRRKAVGEARIRVQDALDKGFFADPSDRRLGGARRTRKRRRRKKYSR